MIIAYYCMQYLGATSVATRTERCAIFPPAKAALITGDTTEELPACSSYYYYRRPVGGAYGFLRQPGFLALRQLGIEGDNIAGNNIAVSLINSKCYRVRSSTF